MILAPHRCDHFSVNSASTELSLISSCRLDNSAQGHISSEMREIVFCVKFLSKTIEI